MAITFNLTYAQSGFECGAEATRAAPFPGDMSRSLNELEWKCVKIKYHVLTNTTVVSSPNPDAQEVYASVHEANKILAPGKIRLVFDNECIHYEDIDDLEYVNQNDIRADIILGRPRVAYEPNALNIYTLRGGVGLASASGAINDDFTTPRIYMRGIIDGATLAHEAGHVFGLYHTHQPWDINGVPDRIECKDGTDCDIASDFICETGADPRKIDLDGDGEDEGAKWVDEIRCIQIAPNTLADQCGDVTTAWNIPATNVMSYYCQREFISPQFNVMHNVIEQHFMHFLIDCNDMGWQNPENPSNGVILISANEVWQNQTVYMQPFQKIIIGPGASLTLDNTTLTAGSHDICPGETIKAPWDGIYLGSPTKCVSDFTSPLGILGSGLNVLNNSVVEYAEFGINAAGIDNSISVDNSILRHNGRAIYLQNRCFLNQFPSNSVTIDNNSQILITEDATKYFKPSKDMIKLGNTLLTISGNSQFEDQTTSKSFDAISLNFGRIDCDRADFKFFANAITLSGIHTHLTNKITNTLFDDNMTDLDNFSRSLLFRYNECNGLVKSTDLCFCTFSNNIFKAKMILTNNQKNTAVVENKFEGVDAALIRLNNDMTFFECNTVDFSNGGLVFTEFKNDATSPPAWGNISRSAGNIKAESNSPDYYMAGHSQLDLEYFYDDLKPEEEFTYLDGISPRSFADLPNACMYGIYGIQPDNGDPVDFEITHSESEWINAQDEKTQLEDALYVLIDGGDTEGLIEWVQNATISTAPSVLSNLLTTSPYLSESVLQALLDNVVLMAPEKKSILLANPDVVRQPSFKHHLQDNYFEVYSLITEPEWASLQMTIRGQTEFEIFDLQRTMGEIVQFVLQNITFEHPLYPNWRTRAGQKFEDLEEVITLWQSANFESLLNYCENLLTASHLSEEEVQDLALFMDGAVILKSYYDQSENIFDLHQSGLYAIVQPAEAGYMDFTALLRHFLDFYYDIHIEVVYPTTELRSVKQPKKDQTRLLKESDVLQLIPNPVNKCYQLVPNRSLNTETIQHVEMSILSINGQLIHTTEGAFSNEYCLPNGISSGLYFLSYKFTFEDREFTGKLKFAVQ